jgi:hypothetical protein
MLLIESTLVLAAVLLAFTFPSIGSRWFEKLERGFSHIARRRALSVAAVGLLALALRAALLPVQPVPEPIVHDEFGYLLSADTFAHGRLTNPTPPMWVHFETPAIIQKPTYQCFAQPAQGLILALGKVVFGHPFWGVWMSIGLMCATLCWMLQGWLPPEWALLGGSLAVLRYGTLTYWANSYWGGAAGAIGGALVLGALPRIKRSPQALYAVLMALGLAILANSRPYEGFVFSLPVAVALFAWMLSKRGPSIKFSLRNIVVPTCGVLAVAAAAMGYYNYRVTGRPLRLPYQVEIENYAVVPYMIWQSLRPAPVFHHEVIRTIYVDDSRQVYDLSRSIVGPAWKLVATWIFYLGPVLTLPLLAVPFALPYGFSWRDIGKKTHFLLVLLATSLVGLSLEVYYNPHYAAPMTGVILTLVLLSVRRLRQACWQGRPVGLFLSRSVPLICTITFVLRVFASPLHIPLRQHYVPAWYQKGPSSFGRARLLRELQQLQGRQLVLVRYSASHEPFGEWVYNEADIDNSKVVWAHDMGAAENKELIDYYRDRSIWLLEPDQAPPRLERYSGSSNVTVSGRDETSVTDTHASRK